VSIPVALAAFVSGCGRDRGMSDKQVAALRTIVEGRQLPAVVRDAGGEANAKRLTDQVRRFYRAHTYKLVWIDGDRPTRRFRELMAAIGAADTHGLDPSRYDLASAARAVRTSLDDDDGIPRDRAPELDVRITSTFFQYVLHLTAGRLDPHAFARLWTLRPDRPDLVKVLADAVRQNNLSDAMQRLVPAHPEYAALQRALERYRKIEEKGGWPGVPAIRRLRVGDRSPAAPVLRRRLAITGDLDTSMERDERPVYDAKLADAVKRFEERHRLKPDGIVDAGVVAAMNVPAGARLRQLQLNMERWRWLPDALPDRYIRINVPDYRLEIIEGKAPVMAMRVIVGKADQPTPIFADEMTHVVFSPYWNVPPGIARNETIPDAAADPGFFERHGMEVLRGSEVIDPYAIDWSSPEATANLRIRQRPGSRNALGLVKFMFPNTFDVYLHDTPTDHLFERIERGFSHGCVRLEEPVALAEYVLRDQREWTRDRIAQAMHGGTEQHVKLKTRIPVFILYLTAWAESNGAVRFLDDLYGHDATQGAHLARASRPAAKAGKT
jgi:murein L,D-transpeptidase YcbB/YkuD